MWARFLDRGVSGLLLLTSVGAFVLEAGRTRPQLDDAYISYRYAANLVAGNGLVYNPGDYVEGITNLLWTLLVACGIRLGFEANHVGHYLGVASGAALLIACWAYALAYLGPGRRWLAGLAPLIVLASTSFHLWSTSGMETVLYAALTLSALAAFAWARLGWTTLFLALATLTRPDGALTAAVIYALYLFPHRRFLSLDLLGVWRILRAPLAYAAVVLAVTAFRLAYYGSPVPNTFYAKVGGVPLERGWQQLMGFVRLGLFPLLLPVAVAIALDRRSLAGAAVGLAIAGYVVSVGGDVFLHFRFFVPLLGILGALAVAGVGLGSRTHPTVGVLLGGTVLWSLALQLFGRVPLAVALVAGIGLGISLVWSSEWKWRARSAGALGATAALILAIPVLLPPSKLTSALSLPAPMRFAISQKLRVRLAFLEEVGRIRARELRQQSPPVELVATGAIGSFGFYSELPVLDIYGLVDRTIARSAAPERHQRGLVPGHQRSNASYVLSRHPDYILIPKQGAKPLRLPAILEIWDHPDFERFYVWDQALPGYRLKSRAPIKARNARKRP